MTEEQNINAGENVEAAAQQASEQEVQDQTVPLAALESERASRQQLQDELSMIKDHLNLLQARQQQPAQAPEESSYSDDDVMTFGEFKKAASQIQNQMTEKLSELEMMNRYPDYQEVITKHLPEVLKKDPALAQDLRNNPNFYRAYYLGKTAPGYQKQQADQTRSEDAERILANTQRPGSLSSMGSTTPINQAQQFKDMSDDEFRELMNKNLGYA